MLIAKVSENVNALALLLLLHYMCVAALGDIGGKKMVSSMSGSVFVVGGRGYKGELSVLVGGVSGRSASHMSCVLGFGIGWGGEGFVLVWRESGRIALHTSSVVMLRAVKGEGLWSSVSCRACDVEVM